ncbi:uncharacterized protein N7446_009490 [Penicillium canescens]|uniref:Uncharacterized protein n=1 Tax=Penicillium canescens TaxID=5083 RepID=A0AAD6N5S0_PENCN|nr:uncharacterized protein N7446_009490 [Penicillium canescens]KAJ6034735.1 hypothetical protein N7460_008910 [Penicillium canescens]KAJ6046398.1 hypothetical protein N7444_007652 [Penicillium canescens]KAJ6053478.1 hypothetical protein N7446_009490 [Penicillium canescens]
MRVWDHKASRTTGAVVLPHACLLHFALVQLATVHGHVGELLLLLGKLEDLLLDATFHDELHRFHSAALTQSMNSIHGLGNCSSRVVLGLHDEHPRCRSQIETNTTSANGGQKHGDFVVLGEGHKRFATCLETHGTIQTDELAEALVTNCDFDQI